MIINPVWPLIFVKNLNLSQSVLAVVRLALSPLSRVPTNRAQEEGVRRERNIFNVKYFHRAASSLLPLSRPSSRLFGRLQWKYMKSYRTNTRHFSTTDHGETLRPGDQFLQIFLYKTLAASGELVWIKKFVKTVICLAGSWGWSGEWSASRERRVGRGRYYINDLVVLVTMEGRCHTWTELRLSFSPVTGEADGVKQTPGGPHTGRYLPAIWP